MKKCTNKILWEHVNVPIPCVKTAGIRNLKIILYIILIAGLFAGCAAEREKKCSINPLFKLDNLKNGDAKFFGENILASVGGKLYLFDRDGTNIARYDINANWISVLEEERTIVYGSFDKTVGICRINKENVLVENQIILASENLMIDPAVLKAGDRYYITATHIDGTVNNADPDKINGRYTVKLYVSKDMKQWDYISDIVDVNFNVEDVRLYNYNGKLQLVYEQELVDKGRSSIRMKESEDFGATWGDSRVLVDCDGDNEPGVLQREKAGDYCFYFSSDKENPGKSYDGAYIYELHLDKQFIPDSECRKIELDDKEGRLLFDVKSQSEYIYLLSEGNYIKDGNLILEEWNRRNET